MTQENSHPDYEKMENCKSHNFGNSSGDIYISLQGQNGILNLKQEGDRLVHFSYHWFKQALNDV